MNNSSFEEQLDKYGKLIYSNVGTSMLPLIREGRDLMIIAKRPAGRLHRYDAVLYKVGERYILHRILRVRRDDYVICGDNCIGREFGIRDEQIIGILTAVVRDGKELPVTDRRIKLYVHLWCDFYHIRAGILYVKAICKALKRKLMA